MSEFYLQDEGDMQETPPKEEGGIEGDEEETV